MRKMTKVTRQRAAQCSGRFGLDAASVMARMQDPAVQVRLIADTMMPVESGAFGSPTFFVDPLFVDPLFVDPLFVDPSSSTT
jgi:2-hydroxychromene-2-carboxylate isomerase